MGTLTEGIKDAVGFVFCAQARALGGLGGLLANLPISGGAIQEVTDRYRAFACGDDPMNSSPVGTSPGFSGGQCAGIQYGVTVFLSFPNNTPQEAVMFNSSYPAIAPIKRVQVFYEGGFTKVLVEDAVRVEIKNKTTLPDATVTGVSIYRIDGQPDNCGDPPAIPPEPVEEIDDELDVTYDDPSGNPVTIPNIPIKFFKPCINLDGVRIPFELDTPFGKICGKIGISPDLPNLIEPSIDIDLCPEQKKDLGYKEEEIKDFFDILDPIGDLSAPAVPSISGILTEDYDIESLPILGVFVRGNPIDFGGNKTIVINEKNATNPNIIIPRIGSVFFEYLVRTKEGYESAFSEDIPIKNANQFIPCPWVFGAIKVHFRREFNCKVAIVPVARKSCCESCKSNDPNSGLDNLDRCRID